MSAKTRTALREQARRLSHHVEHTPDVDLADIAHTLTRRTHFAHRVVILADDRETLRRRLTALADDHPAPGMLLDPADEHPEPPGHLVELPTYPFRRRRYWSSTPARGADPAPPPEPIPARLTDPADRHRVLTDILHRHLADVLGHDESDATPDEVTFHDLGMTSMSMVELHQRLARETGTHPDVVAGDLGADRAHPGTEVGDHVLLALGHYVRLLGRWRDPGGTTPLLLVRPTHPLGAWPASDQTWQAVWPSAHTVADVPGDHLSMMAEHATTTAEVVRRWLV